MVERIFVTRQLPGSILEKLKEQYEVDIWTHETPPTNADIIKRAKNCSGIITLLSDQIDRPLMEALPELKAIAQYAVGYDNIDIAAATERGILVTNTPGVLTETTADLAWALIMATARRISEADKYVKSGKWQVAWGPEMLLGVDVFGATLGIIGMGRIGYAVAQRSVGFNMRILYYSRTETESTRAAEETLQAQRVTLKELLGEADIVSLHVPLSSETRGMISKKEIAIMKRGSIIVNTSRGPIVDEAALYAAVKSGHLRAVGLDVFHDEPTPITNPLLQLDTVVSLPHIGSASIATRTKMAEMCVDNIAQALSGHIPKNIINRDASSNTS
ncbi:MAG: D-glycerate dehydrogenase [Candidatus Thorarchaeota archaeon]|nr:D-glycerate dehydrogenase [Candidatus Thorarchaeota archaeon]